MPHLCVFSLFDGTDTAAHLATEAARNAGVIDLMISDSEGKTGPISPTSVSSGSGDLSEKGKVSETEIVSA